MINPPTRSELAQRLRTFEARYQRTVILWLSLSGVVLVLSLGVVIATADTRFRWVGGCTFLILILSIITVTVFLDRRRSQIARETGTACSGCGKPLLYLNAKLALTTGRCAECGELVISDP